MCTGFQVSSTRSRDLAEQIQGSARWGLRPDLFRPSPNRATFQAPPSVAEERGGSAAGDICPPRESHSISTASTSAVLTPASPPTAVPAPAPADIVRTPQDTEPAIVLVPFTLSMHVPGQ